MPQRLAKLDHRYTTMHELERHIIHAIETLEVASLTLGTVIRDQESFTNLLTRHGLTETLDIEDNIQRLLRSFYNSLSALHRRAEAFEKRLQNEIRLVSVHQTCLAYVWLTTIRLSIPLVWTIMRFFENR